MKPANIIRQFISSKTRAALALTVLAVVSAGLLAAPAAAGVESSYLYSLSTFTGAVPFAWVAMTVDSQTGEVYVNDGSERSVRIFNENGMETYRFGDDDRLGFPRDLAVLAGGDILLLSYRDPGMSGEPELVRCNYRGEPQERIALAGLPSDWSDFRPDRLVLAGERLHLVSTGAMLVAVTDLRGGVTATHDLGAAVNIDARNAGIGGFAVDSEGRFLFSVPVKFQVCRLSPNGTVESFGQAGSTPGKFGITAGVAADPQGNIFVADTLRCVVMVFSPAFQLLTEFGYRGYGPGGLIAPRGVTYSPDGKLYVTQRSVGGVRVFRINGDNQISRPVGQQAVPAA